MLHQIPVGGEDLTRYTGAPRLVRATGTEPFDATADGVAETDMMLPGIRGVRLTVLRVDAKFKYDDHNLVEHRQSVIGHLEQRGRGLDVGAAAQQHRRLTAIGGWKTRRERS